MRLSAAETVWKEAFETKAISVPRNQPVDRVDSQSSHVVPQRQGTLLHPHPIKPECPKSQQPLSTILPRQGVKPSQWFKETSTTRCTLRYDNSLRLSMVAHCLELLHVPRWKLQVSGPTGFESAAGIGSTSQITG